MIELKLLSKEFDDARTRYEKKREYIRAALASGAIMEEGLHSAQLIEWERDGFTVRPGKFKKLIIR